MMRVNAFEAVDGFRDDLIAGEEPELCVRLRAAGWRIFRLDHPMTLHDAAMTRFGQWWRRIQRSGYAFAQGVYLHGASPERYRVWEARRAWLWAVWLPLGCLLAGLVFGPWGWASVADLSTASAAPDRAKPGCVARSRDVGAISDACALSRSLGRDQIHARPPAWPPVAPHRIQVTAPCALPI